MCEVSCKTPTGPVWPTAPHWLSACQTNCFGWQRAVKTAWSRTWECRNSYSLLPFCPVQHIRDYMGIRGWSQGFTGLSQSHPWTCWSYSFPPVPIYSRDDFTATTPRLVAFFGILQYLLPQCKIAPGIQFLCASFSEAPGPSSRWGMKEEFGFPTEHLLHSTLLMLKRSRERRREQP